MANPPAGEKAQPDPKREQAVASQAASQVEEQAAGPGLASVAAAGVAFIGAIGGLTLTGVLGRVQRNSGPEFAWAVTLVLLGAALWLLSFMISPKAGKIKSKALPTRWRNRVRPREAVQALAVVVSIVGLLVGFTTAIGTADDTEQPAVTLKVGGNGASVVGTAKVGNLSSEDRLTVYVDGLRRNDDGGFATSATSNLYQAYVGPDKDGEVSHDIAVTVPPGRYDAVGIKAWMSEKPEDCGAYPNRTEGSESGTGCAIMRLAGPRPAYPQLSASWEGAGLVAESLKVTLEAADTSAGPGGDYAAVQVVGQGGGIVKKTLYRTVIAVPATGSVKRVVRVPVQPGLRTVCARAEMVAEKKTLPSVDCPIRKTADGAVLEMSVPKMAGMKSSKKHDWHR